jgi:hypothetical protein
MSISRFVGTIVPPVLRSLRQLRAVTLWPQRRRTDCRTQAEKLSSETSRMAAIVAAAHVIVRNVRLMPGGSLSKIAHDGRCWYLNTYQVYNSENRPLGRAKHATTRARRQDAFSVQSAQHAARQHRYGEMTTIDFDCPEYALLGTAITSGAPRESVCELLGRPHGSAGLLGGEAS